MINKMNYLQEWGKEDLLWSTVCFFFGTDLLGLSLEAKLESWLKSSVSFYKSVNMFVREGCLRES